MILLQCTPWHALNLILLALYWHLYQLCTLSIPITDTVKISKSVADILAVPIIGTPLEKCVNVI